MIPIKTKEHLIYVMQSGMIRLNVTDLNFIQNLQELVLKKLNLTTNQVALFEKVVYKHRRQLLKSGITLEQVNNLPWETNIVVSDPVYTEPSITIQDDKILFKSPFNKKFLKDFRSIDCNLFVWQREHKVYVAPFSTQALKSLIDVAQRHYSPIRYCQNTSRMLNTIEQYKSEYWEPTLVKKQNFYIAAVNSNLAEAITDLPLNDDPVTLSILAALGIKIDKSISEQNLFTKFASEYFPEIDITNIDVLIEILKVLECELVHVFGVGIFLKHRLGLVEKLKSANIEVVEHSKSYQFTVNEKRDAMAIYFSNQTKVSSSFRKIIHVTNSTPVIIK